MASESDKIAVINIHTASSSLALGHSSGIFIFCKCYIQIHLIHSPVMTEPLTVLFDKLSRKRNTEFYGKPVGPGWLKYEWNGLFCNLYDGAFQCLFVLVTIIGALGR
jgi:hypothetical protein